MHRKARRNMSRQTRIIATRTFVWGQTHFAGTTATSPGSGSRSGRVYQHQHQHQQQHQYRPHSRLPTNHSQCCFFSTIVENQIARWRKQGGEDALQNKGKKLTPDRHADAAAALCANKHDFVHSKILADNNIKPESIVRRLEMDRDWELLRTKIQEAWADYAAEKTAATTTATTTTNNGTGNDNGNKNGSGDAIPSVRDFAASDLARDLFREDMEKLDLQAKGVNHAIISDSLRFNGRSPVRHAKPFRLEERIVMALTTPPAPAE